MTDDTIHTCSYSCERPGCIRAQRDELVAKVEALRAEVERLRAERDALAAENERLKEDRAWFPSKPDDIGRIIEAHIGNLKEGKKCAESLAGRAFDRALRAEAALAEKDKEIAALREDAERWRHARRILTVEDIESSQDMFDAFGVEGDEHESRKADAAIDRARGKGVQEAGDG